MAYAVFYRRDPITARKAATIINNANYKGARADNYFIGKNAKSAKKDFMFFFQIYEDTFETLKFSVKKITLEY